MHEIQTRNFLISIPWSVFNQKPFPKKQILDPSKQEEFANDDFEFDINGKKFSKQVEKTVGKGEIACYKQFLLFPSVFKRLVLQTCKTRTCLGKD